MSNQERQATQYGLKPGCQYAWHDRDTDDSYGAPIGRKVLTSSKKIFVRCILTTRLQTLLISKLNERLLQIVSSLCEHETPIVQDVGGSWSSVGHLSLIVWVTIAIGDASRSLKL